MSVCCSMERSTTPGTFAMLSALAGPGAKPAQIVAEDLHGDVGPRAREHVVDAVGDRLADGDVHPRHGSQSTRAAPARNSSFERSCIVETNVDLRRLDALGVLVQLGAPGAAGGGLHFGERQQDLLDQLSEPVRIPPARCRAE